jgi:hypothetical protein
MIRKKKEDNKIRNINEQRKRNINEQRKRNINVLFERRFFICQSCPYFNHFNERCTVCGCYMRAKVKVPMATCPMNKW